MFIGAMHLSVTASAEGNQVHLGIASAVAAKFSVMHFQVRHAAAALASPAVPS
jgi:hypothetical protein